jgi:hypothetical protein
MFTQHLTKLETPVFAGPVGDLDWDIESKKIVAVGEGIYLYIYLSIYMSIYLSVYLSIFLILT